MKYLRLLWIAVLLAAAGSALYPGQPARATTITVTTTLDDLINNGNCSLREAVIAANTNTPRDACPAGSSTAVDVISLSAGTYTLTIGGAGEDAAASGDLDILQSLTIQGAGSQTTILDGSQLDRVLHSLFSSTTLTLSGLTLRNGLASSALFPNNSGGGIYNFQSTLNLSDVRVTDNRSVYRGGGIYNNGGVVTLDHSQVDHNTVSNPDELVVVQGGGVHNVGILNLLQSSVADNTSGKTAGGIYSDTTLNMTGSTVSGNTAGTNGGGIYLFSGTADILNSTISGNTAQNTLGGGLWVYYENVLYANLTHSTLTANAAGQGGGLYITHQQARLAVENPLPGPQAPAINEIVFIKNSIVSGNTAVLNQNCGVSLQAVPPLSYGYNLEDLDTCHFGAPTDLPNTALDLGPLQDNSGPTFTHALKSSSAAIDQGSCSDQLGSPVTSDQRGVARPQPAGGACDIGAFEYVFGDSADLALTKNASLNPVAPGGSLSYTLGVTNLGPDTPASVILTDTLPAGAVYSGYSGSGWSCNAAAGTVTCTRGSLASGSAPDLTINITAPTSGSSFTNQAFVSSPLLDPDQGNNAAEATTSLQTSGSADLALSKTASSAVVTAGGTLNYTLQVSNLGPDPAENLTLSDELPEGVVFQSAGGDGWTCGENANTLTCSRGTLPVGSAPAVQVYLLAPAVAGELTNNASITASTADPVLNNNNDSALVTVTEPTADQADLAVQKSAAEPEVLTGQSISFTLQVSNLGPDPAAGLLVVDLLPAGLQMQTASGTGWTCNTTSSSASCSRSSLAAGATSSLTVVAAAVGPPGLVNNQASVSAATSDPAPGNNSAAAQITLLPGNSCYLPFVGRE